MNANKYKEKIITSFVEEMLSLARSMEEEGCDAGFNADDIEECKEILFDYIDALAGFEEPDDDEILAEVEAVIDALNEINENTGYTLIETTEREAICEIIRDAAEECGLEEQYGDITKKFHK